MALLALAVAAGVVGTRLGGMQRIARKLLDLNDAAYGVSERLLLTDPGRFPHLDRTRYDAIALDLEDLGCSRLGDFEPLTLNRLSAGQPTFLRAFISKTGTTGVSFYEIRPRRALLFPTAQRHETVVECVSEFNDRFVVTLTGEPAVLASVSDVDEEIVAPGTHPSAVLSRHNQRLSQATLNGDAPRTMESTVDFVEQQFRLTETRRRQLHGVDAVYAMIDRRWPHDPDNWLLKRAVRTEASRRNP